MNTFHSPRFCLTKLLFSFPLVSLFSHIGFTNAGYLLDGGSVAECWKTDLTLTNKVSQYLSGGCPDTVSLEWVHEGPSEIFVDNVYPLEYRASTNLAVVSDSDNNGIRHANLHSCQTYLGACVPSVAKSPGLVTQTAVQKSPFVTDSSATLPYTTSITTDLTLGKGKWTVIAHVRFVTADTQYDIAIASIKTVVPHIEHHVIDPNAIIGLSVYTVLITLVCLISLIVLALYRKRKVIRYSSAPFSIIMLIGCVLGAIAPISFAYVTPSSCFARPVLLSISFTLIFLPLLVKTYRIYKLFGSKKLSHVIIKDRHLMLVIGLFLFFDAIILCIWLSLPDVKPVPTEIHENDFSYTDRCTSKHNDTVAIIIVVYKAVILLVGLLLAYLTRHAPSLFNETKSIMGTMYMFVIIVGVGIPLMSLIVDQPTVTFIIQTFVITLAIITVLAQFFVPKFYLLYTVNDADIQGLGDTGNDKATIANSKPNRSSVASTGNDDNGSPHSGLSSGELKTLFSTGRIPTALENVLKEIESQTDALIKKSGSGYKVKASELLDVRSVLQKYFEYTNSISAIPEELRNDNKHENDDEEKGKSKAGEKYAVEA
mmetsp:Transcript_228/g.210  ORF Transcript_228/g.210 Transcript_228/m.210 type:complete len:597 (+) Transcript_228:81-1871(+)|eukprot:CAMPEP_0182418516 /NCGR_PEP_ID=MMETSP1167-20130531/2927_1 /TAXON_ID=2988 /ORGANISM="Mallomonas Sp, Strain CCMP3275" /LENGTH=596 /DNA_ID=CAMNT_0024592761 /DNA_START=60 /DNA_END=1850 /DNA_ORIENTATION=+